MEGPHLLDLRFLDEDQAIAAYLVETSDGPGLFDCGPATTLDALRAGLGAHGLRVGDLRHLLLSHIHLDHAGAAGALVAEHPDLTVWVSELGAPHLADPSRLVASARRLFGEAFDRLWGEPEPVPERNLRVATGDAAGWDAFPTPGHASHHVSYLREGTLLAGDACGVRIPPSTHVQPVSPPPDVDLDAWRRTVDELERRGPDRLALVHFGLFDDTAGHLRRLREGIELWSERVRGGMAVDEFVAAANADAGEHASRYSSVFSVAMSYDGLRRYWDKREAA
ncbi:MAG TPA: MBL fold metallo-hydrolase [Gaiellaceae bacterium]|nr:MBL fold metallo-hydrolase [Gaiellaceae bacterium]